MWVRFSRTDTCPISPYPEWLGVVVKAEEYGSVRCRVLNGSKGSFPFVLGRYTIQRILLHWPRYFRYFSNCSYTVFALLSRETSDMPRTESFSAMSQDYLDFYHVSSVITFLGLGLEPQCKNGLGPQITWPHNIPSKSCCSTSWSERRVLVMPRLYCGLFRSVFHQCGCLFIYPENIPDYETFLRIHSWCVLAASLSETRL